MNHSWNSNLSIDLTDEKECTVPQDKFEIQKVTINGRQETGAYMDMVHSKPPYFHFQILRFKDEDQKERTIEYFKEHQKLYGIFKDGLEGLLYLGCSRLKDIRSGATSDWSNDDLKNLFPQALHWYRFYGSLS